MGVDNIEPFNLKRDFNPPRKITDECVRGLINLEPRRFRLVTESLKAPGSLGDWQRDWNLIFPFRETFVPTFEMMSPVDHIPFSQNSKGGPSHHTFFPDSSEEDIKEVREWVQKISLYVGIRDCLFTSFALDYEREDGVPGEPQTKMGLLRSKAKPYNSPVTKEHHEAADELIKECCKFLEKIDCYQSTTAIVAVPSSDPNKKFHLARYIAEGISRSYTRLNNLSNSVRTIRKREEMKNLRKELKHKSLLETIDVDPNVLNGDIILVDDLYQSGTTMNFVAMLLQQAGGFRIFGLSCVKTLRNDDNLGGT